MPRDMDLVREMLLAIDAAGGSIRDADALGIPGHPREVLQQHLAMLQDAGFVGREMVAVYTGRGIIADKRSEYPSGYRMTWNGYDFLDSVRDPEVWQKTKTGMSRVGGWTVDLLKDAAKAYLKLKAKEVLGLDL